MNDTVQWIMFQRLFGYGTIRAQKLLDAVGHPSQLFGLPAGRLQELELLTSAERARLAKGAAAQEAEVLLEKAYKLGCTVLTPDSQDYPARLKEIYSPPSVLYLYGSLAGLDEQAAIAMVGTRKHTEYGEQVADELACKLAASGVAIVSGLAEGIDAISHRAALRAGGRTIAVLGCGPDRVYPVFNTELHDRIIREGGAVVTEFPPAEQPLRFHFPIRNRIVSGLSHGVVVVEGGRHSGSLITAGHAVTQGREVFAVPGSIFSPMSQATNWLITQGVTMVTCVDDIFAQFPYFSPVQKTENTDQAEQISFDLAPDSVYNKPIPAYLNQNQRSVLAAIGREPLAVEELLETCGVALPAVLATLTQLELFDLIEACPGRRYKRKQ